MQDRRDQVVHLRLAREMLGSLCAVRLRGPPFLATVAIRLAEEEDRYLARFILELRLEEGVGTVFLQSTKLTTLFSVFFCKISQMKNMHTTSANCTDFWQISGPQFWQNSVKFMKSIWVTFQRHLTKKNPEHSSNICAMVRTTATSEFGAVHKCAHLVDLS